MRVRCVIHTLTLGLQCPDGNFGSVDPIRRLAAAVQDVDAEALESRAIGTRLRNPKDHGKGKLLTKPAFTVR